MSRFRELDTVALVGIKGMGKRLRELRGLVIKCNQSAFGRTYWVQWNDGEDTLVHGSILKKARFDNLPRRK